jgi:hypothetical protein
MSGKINLEREFEIKKIADNIRSAVPNLDDIPNNKLIAIAEYAAKNQNQIIPATGLPNKPVTFKYIIVNTGAILFNEYTTHAQVAADFDKVYSAGFVTLSFDKKAGLVINPYGESDSLKLKSVGLFDKLIILDLFSQVSSIKYLGLVVAEVYEGIDNKLT